MTEAEPVAVDLTDRKVQSYQIILPPGWVQHPVRRGLADRLYEHIRSHAESPDNRELMTQLRTMTHRAIKDLRERGGIDLFLPERTRSEAAVPASLASNLVQLGNHGVEPAIARLARGREVDEVEVPTGLAYRWKATATGKDQLTGLESSNVYYVLPLPGEAPTEAVMFTFGVLKSDDLPTEYVEVLYLIFDAMMQSLIWIYDEDD